jgi:hypothetical protein
MAEKKSTADSKKAETAEPPAELDDILRFEISRSLSKVGVLATMIQTRLNGLADNRFAGIADLVDIYEQAARAQFAKGIDYRAEGLGLDGNMQTQVNVLVRRIFSLD